MNKDIENIYLDFFSYYDSVKEKFLYILEKCIGVDIIFEGVIDNLYSYYERRNENINNSQLSLYFELDDFLNSIIDKIKELISFINTIFYDVLEQDEELFNTYVGVIYYISILEDLVMYLESKNMDTSDQEQELLELNNIIKNKVELVDGFNEYIGTKINEIISSYEEFTPSIVIFKIINTLFEKNFEETEEDYLQNIIDEFINNMGSFSELTNQIKEKDMVLYNKIFKLENVILNLQVSLRSDDNLFGENDEEIKTKYLSELNHLYGVWLTELHRIYDLYGIDYSVKYQDIIYYASLINEIVNSFGDIEDSNEQLGDYFLACYDSIIENNLDDIEQFIDYGKDLLDDLCEKYDLVTNKLEEQIEFIYILLKNKY